MKSKLGQFYTTNYEYILQNLIIPEETTCIIEPFAGNGDLLNFIKNKDKYTIESYDIEPKQDYIIKRDTLKNPPNYDNKFVLTNPPYLARNKCDDKEIYNKYNTNDLYKCFLLDIIDSNCLGGIIIIPLNFISSIRKSDIELRKLFLEKFNIVNLNIFEEQVFNDTKYSVCSFQFEKKKESCSSIDCHIYPSNKIMTFSLTEENNYTIGGEIYNLPKSNIYKIERATKLTKNKECITNILLKCIDDTLTKIQLKIDTPFIDTTENLSARSYATLVITPKINIDKQKELVEKFNEFLENYRNKYNSYFLTNYRENARKRISFELAFSVCSYLLSQF